MHFELDHKQMQRHEFSEITGKFAHKSELKDTGIIGTMAVKSLELGSITHSAS